MTYIMAKLKPSFTVEKYEGRHKKRVLVVQKKNENFSQFYFACTLERYISFKLREKRKENTKTRFFLTYLAFLFNFTYLKVYFHTHISIQLTFWRGRCMGCNNLYNEYAKEKWAYMKEVKHEKSFRTVLLFLFSLSFTHIAHSNITTTFIHANKHRHTQQLA